ncbi:MAG: HD domain-containing protein [Solirubrobacteraceae bacterium]
MEQHVAEQPEPGAIRDLRDGTHAILFAVVQSAETGTTRAGQPYLKLELSDRTGRLRARRWDCTPEEIAALRPGTVVKVGGAYSVHERWGPQLIVERVRVAADEEYDLTEMLDGPPRSAEQMETDLRELIETIQDGSLRALLDALIGPGSALWEGFRIAPAAKHYHQAYRHGLLEHCLTVAQGVSAMAATFPGIDRDVAVTGALLHDIGKLEAYTDDPLAIDLTDAGRLQGEIPLGYYVVRRAIEDLPGFPPDRAQAVLHIILSHHGALEHGSPVLPATREATLVHMIDNLGGRLGSFDRIEKGLADGEAWSGFDRALGGGAFFAGRAAA